MVTVGNPAPDPLRFVMDQGYIAWRDEPVGDEVTPCLDEGGFIDQRAHLAWKGQLEAIDGPTTATKCDTVFTGFLVLGFIGVVTAFAAVGASCASLSHLGHTICNDVAIGGLVTLGVSIVGGTITLAVLSRAEKTKEEDPKPNKPKVTYLDGANGSHFNTFVNALEEDHRARQQSLAARHAADKKLAPDLQSL